MIENKRIEDLIYAIICKYRHLLQICQITLLDLPELKQNILVFGEAHEPPANLSNNYLIYERLRQQTGTDTYSLVTEVLIQIIRLLASYQKINVMSEILIPSYIEEMDNVRYWTSYESTATVHSMNYFKENKHPNVDLHVWDIRDISVINLIDEIMNYSEYFNNDFRHNRKYFIKALNNFFGLPDSNSKNLESLLNSFGDRKFKTYADKVFKSIFIKNNKYFNDMINRYLRIENEDFKFFFRDQAFPFLFKEFIKDASILSKNKSFWKNLDSFFNYQNNMFFELLLLFAPMADMYFYLTLLTPMSKNKTSVYVAGDYHATNIVKLVKLQFGIKPSVMFTDSEQDTREEECMLKKKDIKKACERKYSKYNPCKSGEFYNIESRKCLKHNKYVDQIRTPLKDRLHPCENSNCSLGKTCNPLSGRCIRDIYSNPHYDNPSRKKITDCSEKNCPQNKVCNPRTMQCITKDGRLYNQLFKCNNKMCPRNNICNPKTKRCIKINGPTYKKI